MNTHAIERNMALRKRKPKSNNSSYVYKKSLLMKNLCIDKVRTIYPYNHKLSFEITSPRSLPSVPSKSITRVQGSMPEHFANQIPLVVWDLKKKNKREEERKKERNKENKRREEKRILLSLWCLVKNKSDLTWELYEHMPSPKCIHLPKVGPKQMI